MSSIETTYDDAALGGKAIARDRAGELLGQVMGYVAVTIGFGALGAYLGPDLRGGAGLVLFIGAFGCIFGLSIAAGNGREQLAIELLLGLGLSLGFAVVPASPTTPGPSRPPSGRRPEPRRHVGWEARKPLASGGLLGGG